MKAFFIAVGSELLDFKLNTYTQILSNKLGEMGIKLNHEATVEDDFDEILSATKYALSRSELIIICGGLGPTFDDLTRKAVSILTKRKLIFSNYIYDFLKQKYRFKKLKKNLKNQCMAVENAMLLENPNGTAFGEIIEFNGKIIILIPGPLNEWLSMWDKIKDFLSKKLNSKKRIYSVRFKIADLKESELEKALKPITKKDFTILSGPNICEFILRGYDKRKIEKLKIKVEKIIGPNIYGYEEDTIEKKLGELLKQKGKTLSIAESCTGGLVSSRITDIPGSSAYYLGGINAYSNEIKTKMIKVNKKTIKKYGAVSEQTAYEMALKSRKIFDSDYSVSVTGIAGPEGGTEDKPVGLVWFGISGKEKTLTEKRIFLKKDRSYIKEAAANTAMFLLYKMIK